MICIPYSINSCFQSSGTRVYKLSELYKKMKCKKRRIGSNECGALITRHKRNNKIFNRSNAVGKWLFWLCTKKLLAIRTFRVRKFKKEQKLKGKVILPIFSFKLKSFYFNDILKSLRIPLKI